MKYKMQSGILWSMDYDGKKENSMKRVLCTGSIILALCITYLIPFYTSASADTLTSYMEDINAMVEEQMRKAHIPSVSIGIVKGQESVFLSYGDDAYDETSLYQIGSVSKGYTALGILMLEDVTFLRLDDPVSQYLPWFVMHHNGEEVPAGELTIADLLYQTSGFTNDETKYPNAKESMSLEENVRELAGRELTFYPGTQYAYANANYNTLGLLIEVVSGQSYQSFMETQILNPLGLLNTYVDPNKAEQSPNRVVPGSRVSFGTAFPYELEVAPGSVPAGYIISGVNDMTRWMQVQMGLIDVPESIADAVENSHIARDPDLVDEGIGYACGWFVDNTGLVYHSGGTANYSSKVIMKPEQGLGVCVLTNINASANTNAIVDNILNILEGYPVSPYTADIWTVVDTIFSLITGFSVLVCLFCIVMLIRFGIKHVRKGKIRIKPLLYFIASVVLLIIVATIVLVFPMVFQSGWLSLVKWAPISLVTGTSGLLAAALLLLVVGINARRQMKRNTSAASKEFP